ncbi:hypothetical protein CSA56_12575 [candidate division KSB3 bacterium]|uniref:Peptidase MA-like domain-containing protein n=1 Tax=candidate division KSB3 bacterium TaxID=2044937 RepID=A0A2G6KBV8_9BACT|nr:MAG: hypothetical protein CSA56_12575 [candidate division KSB3 bacterium]
MFLFHTLSQYVSRQSFLTVILLVLFPFASLAASWETLKTPHFYIHHDASDTRTARMISDKAEHIYSSIAADVGYAPTSKINVYLCPTLQCFHHKQPSQHKAPEWAVGLAYPALSRIVMRSAFSPQEGRHRIKPIEIFQHELAHIVLEQALAERGGAPRWLSEGFSMYHARQWTIHGQRTIEEVVLRKTFIPLSLLISSFPVDEQAARIAYAQSFSLVSFMLQEYGQTIFHKFIAHLREGMETNRALLSSAGITVKRLELEWHASLTKRYSWFSYLSNIGALWFVLSLVFILAYFVKRHKVRRLHQQWEEEEL